MFSSGSAGRVVLPALNLDFESSIHIMINPASPSPCSKCSSDAVSRNQKCCHSAPAIFPMTNPVTPTSSSSISSQSQDPSESSNDQNDGSESEDIMMQTQELFTNSKFKKKKTFVKITKDEEATLELSHHSQRESLVKVGSRNLDLELHPPFYIENKNCTPIERQSDLALSPDLHPQSSINGVGTSPKFVLKGKSSKIRNQVFQNAAGTQSDDARNKFHSTDSISKLDINGNAMNCTDMTSKPAKPKNISQTLEEEPLSPNNYVPPLQYLMRRFKLSAYETEAENGVSEDENENDLNSFRPPSLPKDIQEKLLETIQAVKKTMASPSQREDHGQGEDAGLQKNDGDIKNEDCSKIHHISFHYESKDGCLDNLTATGFSFNLQHPTVIDEQLYLPHPVSTYFPGKRVSSNITNFGIPTPSFMKPDFYRSGESSWVKSRLNQLVMDKTQRARRTLSNLSMMPMMYSENGSSPRIHELILGPSAPPENVTMQKEYEHSEHNPVGPLRKPKIPNSAEILEALELNNNRKLDTPERKTSDFRFSAYYRDLTKRLKPAPIAFQQFIIPFAKKNTTEVDKRLRPVTRQASNLTTSPTVANLEEVSDQKTSDKKIAKATVQRAKSIGNSLKPVLSQKPNSCSTCSSPKTPTTPYLTTPSQFKALKQLGQNAILTALRENKRENFPPPRKPVVFRGLPMPPSIKNAEPNATRRRVALKLNAQLEKGHHEPVAEAAAEGASQEGDELEKTLKIKPASKSKPLRTKKLKYPVINDPYYLNSTESEKEIIKELVRADVDAMLERDAVALLTPDENELLEEFQEPPPPPPVQNKPPKKEIATHWSWRAKDATKTPTVLGNKPKLFVGAGPTAAAKNKSRVPAKARPTIKGKPNPVLPSSLAKSKRK